MWLKQFITRRTIIVKERHHVTHVSASGTSSHVTRIRVLSFGSIDVTALGGGYRRPESCAVL